MSRSTISTYSASLATRSLACVGNKRSLLPLDGEYGALTTNLSEQMGESGNAAISTFLKTWWAGTAELEFPNLIVNRKGLALRANPAAIRVFGHGYECRQYLSYVERKPTHSTLSHDHLLHRCLKGSGHTVPEDLSIEFTDKTKRRFLVTGSPVLSATSRPRAAALLFVDITRQQKIVEIATQLSRTDSWENLIQGAVDAAQSLGFNRTRLYSFDGRRQVLRLERAGGANHLGTATGKRSP
jgi:hypothetical protein